MLGPNGIRQSSFSKEDPLKEVKVRLRNELYDVPMIRMDDFDVLEKTPVASDADLKRINDAVKVIRDLKEKYKA